LRGSNSNYYDKVKHLVEIDDDILSVFIVESSQIKDLHIAKNANIDRAFITLIFDTLKSGDGDGDLGTKKRTPEGHNLLGDLKWVVLEYEHVRVLKIIEKSKIVVVLINSNTKLQHTIGNILGYYYDRDEIPKSLF